MDRRTCNVCNKIFRHISSRDRHVREVHTTREENTSNKKVSKHNIYCPLCFNANRTTPLKTYQRLMKHLEIEHQKRVEIEEFSFSDTDFNTWMQKDRKKTNYTIRRKNKYAEYKYEMIFYDCNRSYDGYKSKSSKRFPKSSKTIKISGTCPSRIIAKIFENGIIKVKYVKTHVGHQQELRCQRLTKEEKDDIINKLKSGVTKSRILKNARKIEGHQLNRLNLLTQQDLRNIENVIIKSRDSDDMTATAIKVLHEWNSSDQKFGFLFKQIGEKHFALRDEDFAVGFMNQVMERKLKEFKDIICMDGTHNTNIRGWELTTVLVKDDRGVGFPVAFLVSNRRDQLIYEVFLGALKEKIEIDVKPLYFMTDDDPKYYNAWVKVMNNQPQHLLCSWHIVKSWSIQGRAKLKNLLLKNNMKKEMRKILCETNEGKFEELCLNYFKKLTDENETEYLNYLMKYYFQDKKRIQMWSHCYRKNAGINTNMAIESLHKFIKYDELNKKRNNSIEKLLDILEKVVEDKGWKRIVELERPSANDYQQRLVRESHNRATQIENNVEEVGFGEFLVKSLNSNKFYKILYGNRMCGSDCRLMYCTICEFCFHQYTCQCPQYVIKATTCKHVHMVAMFERAKSEFSLRQANESVTVHCDHNYCKKETVCNSVPENISSATKKEVMSFMDYQENRIESEPDEETFKKIKIESFNNMLSQLSMTDFRKLMEHNDKWIRRLNYSNLTKKRTQQKQTFFAGRSTDD